MPRHTRHPPAQQEFPLQRTERAHRLFLFKADLQSRGQKGCAFITQDQASWCAPAPYRRQPDQLPPNPSRNRGGHTATGER